MSIPPRQFRDPVAREAYDQINERLAAGEAPASLLEEAGEARLSEVPGKRLWGAAAYSAVARQLANDGDAEDACYIFHYAGQVFRSLGMGGNAAAVYEQSTTQGEIASRELKSGDPVRALEIQKFALRSAGRAVVEYANAGRPDKATDARIRFHDAQRLELRIDESWLERVYDAWRFALFYNLSWPHAGVVAFLLCLPWLSGGGRGGLILALLGLLSLGLTAWRRIRP